jgi:hypothetical protein
MSYKLNIIDLRALLVFLILCNTVYSQSEDLLQCGADELRIETLKMNPKIADAVNQRELWLESFTQQFVDNPSRANGNYIIPVVFHVIHTNGPENISEAQIKDGIRILNERFNKTSADTTSIVPTFQPIHADCEIEFRLAGTDPNGFCTDGINRIESTLSNIGNHDVKALIQWPTDMYLNFYVVQNAYGLAGHAMWPSDADTIPEWDGIVMAHDYVGSIGTASLLKSVVMTHEAGHYLNLHHIWGGNNVPGYYFLPVADPNKDCTIDDYVADTPPTIGWQSCNLNGTTCDTTLDNVQNAMDYSYCNKMLTYGQKARMHACLNSPIAGRNNLHTQSNLIATGVFDTANVICEPLSIQDVYAENEYSVFPNPAKNVLSIRDQNANLVSGSAKVYDLMGKELQVQKMGNYYDVSNLKNGVYNLTFRGIDDQMTAIKFIINK